MSEAVAELWRCAGTQFDSEVVQQLMASGVATQVGGPRGRLDPTGAPAVPMAAALPRLDVEAG